MEDEQVLRMPYSTRWRRWRTACEQLRECRPDEREAAVEILRRWWMV